MDDLLSGLLMIAVFALLVVFIFRISTDWDKTPAQRAGFPDPPPLCVKGELPKRIYLSNGGLAFTCRIP